MALIFGADLLVQKFTILAKKFNINPFIVGVFLLGMGTSAPEWAVSVNASLKGLSHLAVSNVVGSNIINILLVLGIILLSPLSVTPIKIIKTNILFLILSSFVLLPIILNNFISPLEALILISIFITYIAYLYLSTTNTQKKSKKLITHKKIPLFKESCFIILGFTLLIGGSHFTVMGATELSQKIGISERLMGILLVSVGTSLPELFTSIIAIMKNQTNMAIGNIIGSNIFNTFAILGTASWINSTTLDPKIRNIDIPVLLIVNMSLLLIIYGYQKTIIKKTLPYAFFTGYIAYISYLLIG